MLLLHLLDNHAVEHRDAAVHKRGVIFIYELRYTYYYAYKTNQIELANKIDD